MTLSGTYYDTLATTEGCDSVLVLTLTVNPVYETPLTAEICDGETFSFGGEDLTLGGTYYDTLATSEGCDSVLVL